MARYMRTDLGSGHTRLRPPVVVGAAVPAPLAPPLAINLAPRNAIWRRNNQRGPDSRLEPPAVVSFPTVSDGIRGSLHPVSTVAFIARQRRTTYQLSPPPTILGEPAAEPIVAPFSLTLAPSRRGEPFSKLGKPVVVFTAVELSGPEVSLAPSPKQALRPHPNLNPPVVIDLSPQVNYLSVHLAYSRRGVPKTALQPPTDTRGLEDQGTVQVTLAPSARQSRTPHSDLAAPTVVFTAVELSGPVVSLAPSAKGVARSRLAPPIVVRLAVELFGPRVQLAPSSKEARKSRSSLAPPVVVFTAVELFGPEITLASSSRGTPRSRLSPPLVVAEVVEEAQLYPVAVHLALQLPRRPVRPAAVYPIVVFAVPDAFGWVAISLAPSRRGSPTTFLRPPIVSAAQIFFAGKPHLARIRPPRVKSVLHPPVVIDLRPQTRFLSINLAYSRRGVPKSELRAPAVIRTDVFFGPAATLAYSVRGKAKPQLGAPTVIDLTPQVYYLNVTLAPSRRGVTQATLRPPVVVAQDVFFGPSANLTYSSRGQSKSRLSPPTVVVTVEAPLYPVSVNLTYSSRGIPHSQLLPPAVVGAGVFYDGLAGESLPLFPEPLRRRPLSRLFPPVVLLAEELFFGPETRLAYSRRGRPLSVLGKPVVVDFVLQTYFVNVTLAYSRRGRPISSLQPPVVVAPRLAVPIAVQLAYSRRGRPKSLLRPPTMVFPFVARQMQIALAPQTRGVPKSTLLPPAVVAVFTAPPVRISFVRIKPQPTTTLLQPPTVVNTPEPVLYPVSVTLAYSLSGKPKYFYTGIALTEFVPDEGEVCGVDEPITSVQGTSAADTTVCGDDEALGTVCGDDEQAT